MLFRAVEPVVDALTAEPRLLVGECRSPFADKAIELRLADRRLRLYPEYRFTPSRESSNSWLLVDEERYFTKIAGFVRIAAGQKVMLGRDSEASQAVFGFDRPVKRRQLEIENENGVITCRRLGKEAETLVCYLDSPQEAARPWIERLEKLQSLRRLLGDPIAPAEPERAVALAQQVNGILRSEPHRPRDCDEQPGGLVDLPASLPAIIVGDLHAQVDNLLRILSADGFLSALSTAQACLVLLGDTVHPDRERDLAQMDSSLLMLDLVFRLKIAFPDRVFYLRGNHESFEAHVGKGGVPQGTLLRRRARELRGPAYEAALTAFFERLPYVARSRSFIACHGGPPRRPVILQDLIDIRRHRGLAQELIWNRVRRPNHLAGYGERNVNAFKQALGVGRDIPLIVGHTPLSDGETLWREAGGIGHHHILHGSHPDKAAVFADIDGRMVPLEFPAEPLIHLANSLRDDAELPAARS